MQKVKVWTCKIVVPDVDLPEGFDFPPRSAAQHAIESAGIPIIMNSSGWGGELTEEDKEYLSSGSLGKQGEIYYVGVMDAPEDVAH